MSTDRERCGCKGWESADSSTTRNKERMGDKGGRKEEASA